ncbi:WD repeat-containing protein 74 isoform X2 [Nematostella vectensis]|uniref:WD repeat-containing protein 74 isoform X2 n=1 Tax=Nematostella vectensis TaxID=45351 RepID=UPI0020777605|nr:WD repeat-containing protein 74 isoform X2 [Nematostella vectensis]
MADDMFADLWVGSETGFLKSVDLKKGSFKNADELQGAEGRKDNEICAMCWLNGQDSEMLVGLRSGVVKTYNSDQNTVVSEHCSLEPGDVLKGMCIDGSFLATCGESGLARVWNKNEWEKKAEFKVGSHVSAFKQNPSSLNQVGSGGRENDLKLWNLENPGQATFKAKNVRNDSLDLRVPVWVTDIAFLDSASPSPTVVTGSGYHSLRVYDTTAQKRPVLTMDLGECPISSIAIPGDENLIIAGNTEGTLAAIDIRKGKVVGHFKGFAGGIRCVACDIKHGLVAACGLDRFVRVYDTKTRQLQQKVYLKSRLNYILFANKERPSDVAADPAVDGDLEPNTRSLDGDNSNEDDDELWANMEEVSTQPKRRSKNPTTDKSTKKLKKAKKSKKSLDGPL